MRSARIKADQIKAVPLDIVCAACEICLSQLSDHGGHATVNASVKFLTDMVADSLQVRSWYRFLRPLTSEMRSTCIGH
jgi:Fe-S oxidoreductase